MENLPVQIFPVADGAEAIAFIERAENDATAPRPDLVVLDLNLPKSDGFDVLRYLRASGFREIPVLVVTSSNAPNDREMASELGAGYFRKTPSYLEFLKLGTAIRDMLPPRSNA